MSSIIEFDPSDGTVINKIIKVKLTNIRIPSFVTRIKGGDSNTDSAFYPCANSIKNITFDENSNISSLGNLLFSGTTLEYIDMSTCPKLESLSYGLFYRCTNLKNVSLPPNLKTISSGSFSSCTSIESLNIPDSVETIEGYDLKIYSVFSGCKKLKTLKISENSSLKAIKSHAFLDSGIESFFIPKNVETIGDTIFMGSYVETIVISPENKFFRTDGVIIFKGDEIITTAVNSKIDYVIPENATLGRQAFRGSHFNTITFADKHYSLPVYCFSSTYFKTIKLPDAITIIPDYCFHGSKIESIVLPNSVTEIQKNAFSECNCLKNITLPLSLITIGNNAFKSAGAFLYIEIPYNVINFGQSVFTGCNKNLVVNFTNKERFEIVNELVINNGSTIVEYFGDDDTYELKVPSFCTTIGNELFKEAAIKSVTFEHSENQITFGDYAFAKSTLQLIVFPQTLASIGKNCFRSCTCLKHVVFDGKVTEIPESCFRECTALDTLIFNDNTIKTIGKYSFYQTKLLPKIDLEALSVENIDEYAFSESGIKSIVMPHTILKISKYAFQNSSVVSYKDNTYLTTLTDFLFSGSTSLFNVVLGNRIETIGQYSFENCYSLNNITLSPMTSKIEMYAFKGCISLEFITIPEHSKLNRIMPFAFDGCNRFSDFKILDNISFYFHNKVLMNAEKTSIVYYIPQSKERLFVVPAAVITISAYAFQSCRNIREVIIPDGSIKEIGVNAFQDCTNLKRIVLPPSITKIGSDAFEGCTHLKCGGVVIEQELVEEAKKSGIREDILTPYCISSSTRYDAISCKRNSKYISSTEYMVTIFLYSFINNSY